MKKIQINPRYFGPQKIDPSLLGPALMAHGCFGALHLAAARPTHNTDSWKQANNQGRCVRETETIIGKAPRLGIHTPYTNFMS